MSDLSGSWSERLRRDLPAGLVVFLVALPLCLGIALASNAPLVSGIIAGIIGGVVVGLLSGSEVSVSGPAAGLAVIVAGGIAQVGGFPAFAAAVAISGLLQLGIGFAGAGRIADYVPTAVIKGLLAAIGLVIILKQIPHALGRDSDFEGDLSFFVATGSNTIVDIARAVYSANPVAVVIAGTAVGLLLLWGTKRIKTSWLSSIPGPLLAVLSGVAINECVRLWMPGWELRTEDGHLVSLPVAGSWQALLGQLQWPDFGALARKETYLVGATVAIVGSLETLLNLEAADKLDPLRRISDPNRELKAQGAGNLLSGLLGGMPLTSVVVRTSANVYAGGRSRWSAVFHGLLLLAATLAIPVLLNRIPLAALAAILILVGYKLASVKLFREVYDSGWDQFLPFAVTVSAIVFSDLLIGVLCGIVCGLFFLLRTNHHKAISMVSDGSSYLMRLNKDASFLNKTELKRALNRVPDGATLIVDGTKAGYIDKDIYDVLRDFAQNSLYRGIEIEYKNFFAKSRSMDAPI
jgi:MFS superfamily sulfate permease-like transporter